MKLKPKEQIYCVEFNEEPHNYTGKKLEVDAIIPKEIENTVKEHFVKWGIKIVISQITDTEKFIENYFAKQGYTVIRCIAIIKQNKEIENIVTQNGLPSRIIKAVSDAGVPDYFCFRNHKDWFFVEVKTGEDGIRMTQVHWLVHYGLRTKIIYIARDIDEDIDEAPANAKRY